MVIRIIEARNDFFLARAHRVPINNVFLRQSKNPTDANDNPPESLQVARSVSPETVSTLAILKWHPLLQPELLHLCLIKGWLSAPVDAR